MKKITVYQALSGNFPETPLWVDATDISAALETLKSFQVYIEPKPTKPKPIQSDNSEEIRQYADMIEVWQKEVEDWEKALTKSQLHNMQIDARMLDLVKRESGLIYVPEKYQNKVFSLAWSKGHYAGHYEVFLILRELVEIFLD